ncbi:hypothetical protein EZV73_22760 [Acidaminobacter sp. JC074]|uniref:hypothetical protein n=1 Tax=Acidaminobacter sp. JC074 TaxID=2530199 RepID=UPI001F10C448|nr:hypothetical protein [Acidaminobacter sp. JC074]MCH4890422.1 hypothetical protein [Acidaminobacter sp. JC074]
MLSGLLLNIYNNVKEKIEIDEKTIYEIDVYLKKKKGRYIYFESFQKLFHFNDKETSIIFGEFVKASIMEMKFQQFCPSCNTILHGTYDSVFDLLGKEVCDDCGETLFDDKEPFKYITVKFKVKK